MDTRLVGLASDVAGGSRRAAAVAEISRGRTGVRPALQQRLLVGAQALVVFHLKRGWHSAVSCACQGGMRPDAAAAAIAAANGRADS